MTLAWLILIPLFGGLAAWLASVVSANLCRWTTVGTLVLLTAQCLNLLTEENTGAWMAAESHPWIPQIGANLSFAVDGISLLLVLISILLSLVAVLVSWKTVDTRIGAFHFNILWVLSGVLGVFLATDLFLFFFAYELMVIPMYFLIAFWGDRKAGAAATKFILYTQASGLVMLAAIFGLYALHGKATGDYTFAYDALAAFRTDHPMAPWLMAGFFFAFAVKLPIFPFHGWQPDAYTHAPTAGSIILAGFLGKTGAYGLVRFVLPIFEQQLATLTPLIATLAVITLFYGAMLAFAQRDIKRLIAYSSLGHMGFVMLGILAGTFQSLQGVMVMLLSHGFVTAALFAMAGMLETRTRGIRDMERMGGLWKQIPVFSTLMLVLVLISLGIPGGGNFVAEILILIGSFGPLAGWTIAALVGLIVPAVYSLWLIQRAFHGQPRETHALTDLDAREKTLIGALVVVLLWIGLFPSTILQTGAPALALVEADPVPPPALTAEPGPLLAGDLPDSRHP
ncbi:MAG: complex I subunit 4 family protein [Opitutales bacterium]